MTTILENKYVSLAVDERGRAVKLQNKVTETELIRSPEAAQCFRLIVPSGRHTIDFIQESNQAPPKITLSRNRDTQLLRISYEHLANPRGSALPVKCAFIWELRDDSPQLLARVEIDNTSDRCIEEVEFPIAGGLGVLPCLLTATHRGRFHGDVLQNGLPVAGRDGDHFCRENESAMFEPDVAGYIWAELYSDAEGLSCWHRRPAGSDFAIKIERFPKFAPNGTAHLYPTGTPRWLRVFGLHVPRIKPGAQWRSENVVLLPHAGDWHAGADEYAKFRCRELKFCQPPAWTRNFAGWSEIVGKLYTGEVFHDYRKCAEDSIADKQATGLDFIFYYGHSKLGAEGGDIDQLPSEDLGGETGFREMITKLHDNGCRVMLLDHLHRFVNRDAPEYATLNPERWATRTSEGALEISRWWKETFLSCRRLEGPTPEWIEICPACEEFHSVYLAYVTQMIERGVDGLELDCYLPLPCHARNHGHEPGDMTRHKAAFINKVRAHAKKLNPNFVLLGEEMLPETLEVLDGFYSTRYPDEDGRIYRYLFPDIRFQTVRIGNYAYDAVNRAVMLGIGVNTEIWGLRKTTLAGCPELANYIGEVNRFRRKHADVMMHGTFRDTLGAIVSGGALHSVLEAMGTRALVVRNDTATTKEVSAQFTQPHGRRFILWRPGTEEKSITALPVSLALGPYEMAIVIEH